MEELFGVLFSFTIMVIWLGFGIFYTTRQAKKMNAQYKYKYASKHYGYKNTTMFRYNEKDYKVNSLFWKKFAKDNDLTFQREDEFIFIEGSYKGHPLKMETNLVYENTDINVEITQKPEKKKTPLKNFNHTPEYYTTEGVIKLLMPTDLHVRYSKIKVNTSKHIIYFKGDNLRIQGKRLSQTCQALINLAYSYPTVVALGGQVVPALGEITREGPYILRDVAATALKQIAKETRQQAHKSSLICPYCISHFRAYKVSLSVWQVLTYYGCKHCGQSQTFIKGEIVAVLDTQMTSERVETAQSFRINCLTLGRLFEFDRVEIIQANDEAVERFAVLLGNDTDVVRKARYKEMTCTISETCQLSENTIHILKEVFGKVTMKTG